MISCGSGYGSGSRAWFLRVKKQKQKLYVLFSIHFLFLPLWKKLKTLNKKGVFSFKKVKWVSFVFWILNISEILRHGLGSAFQTRIGSRDSKNADPDPKPLPIHTSFKDLYQPYRYFSPSMNLIWIYEWSRFSLRGMNLVLFRWTRWKCRDTRSTTTIIGRVSHLVNESLFNFCVPRPRMLSRAEYDHIEVENFFWCDMKC